MEEEELKPKQERRTVQRQMLLERLDKEKEAEKRSTVKYVLDELYQDFLAAKNFGTLIDAEDIDAEAIADIGYYAARPFYNQLNDYLKEFKAANKKYLKKRDQWFPTKWMLDDPAIYRLLGKYPKIPDILNALETVVKKQKKENMFSLEGQKYKSANGTKYEYAAFMTDKDFYKEISPKLELSENAVRQYLKAFRNTGAIRLLDKTGANRNIPIYALGYFTDWNGYAKLNRFLTQEMKTEFGKLTIFSK